MATANDRVDRLYRVLSNLPESELYAVERFLDLIALVKGEAPNGNMTEEDQTWMDEDVSALGEVEEYDWGPDGPPEGRPIAYVPGTGLVVQGGKKSTDEK